MVTEIEARRARMELKDIGLRQTTSHPSLLVARQGDVSRKLNQAFLLVDSFNFNFVDEERSDIYDMLYPHSSCFVICVAFTTCLMCSAKTSLWQRSSSHQG